MVRVLVVQRLYNLSDEQMGGKALRSIGLARATLHLNWKAATYNLRRLCSLMEVGPAPF